MKLTRTTRNAGWLVVAGLLGAALIAPAGAAANGTVWATVTGHAEDGPTNNDPDTWGEDCTKLDSPKVDGKATPTWVLTQDYGLVVVKAGSDQSTTYANTLFANASAGETVWADSNGNNEFDAGDKEISHIIFCDPTETTTTTSSVDTETTTTTSSVDTVTTTSTSSVDTVTTTSVTGTVAGETGEPTPPSTDAVAFSSTSSTTGSGWSLLLVAMAGLLAAALLLTPAAAVRKR